MKAMTLGAIAAMLFTILYSRCFFLYCLQNPRGAEGKEALYSFDLVALASLRFSR